MDKPGHIELSLVLVLGCHSHRDEGREEAGACLEPTLTQSTPLGINPREIAAGDLDGDGDIDLLATLGGESTFVTLRNDGAGRFEPWDTYPANYVASGIGAGDFDSDGDADVLVAVVGGIPEILRYRNDGYGAMGEPEDIAVDDPYGMPSEQVLVADLNGDDAVDVVAASAYSRSISVRLQEAGVLARPAFFDFDYTQDLELGDFNADGVPDLIGVLNEDVNLMLGDGTGGFGPVTRWETGFLALGLAVGDFGGDGNLDAAVGGTGALAVLWGDGEGFGVPIRLGVAGGRLEAADLDGDGIDDIVATEFEGHTTRVILGSESGFMTPWEVEAGAFTVGIALAQLDGEGGLDIATVDNSDGVLRVYLSACAP
ncbi:MAG: VCBS repeat-containing protein [Pseudomonadota bacterium]|nr:VCBS repeat-containing protein [Pseudomonadota bacterium]